MASRIGILVVAFLSYIVVASGIIVQVGPTDEQKPGPRPGPKPVQEPGPKPVQEPGPKPGQEPEPKPGQQPGPQPGQQPGPRPVPGQEPGPQPGQQPGPRPVPGQEPGPKPGLQQPGQQPGPKPGLDPAGPGKEGLREGFYKQSCPEAENIVNATLHKHLLIDPTFAAGLLRLYFHDCFVTGCDASILLDVTPSQEFVEKKADENGKFVRGFQVIDDIKLKLEEACPGVVSCADILAYATRDSLVSTGMPPHPVPGGRRDGLASLATNVKGNLPTPEFTAEKSIELFERKGMTLEELVVLIGSHSIGNAHCDVVSMRFHDDEKMKDIDRGYWLKMQTMTICANENQDVPFDSMSLNKMDSKFYNQLLTKKALIESDQLLANEPRANGIMKKMVGDNAGWQAKFINAMRRLGETEVLVGNAGQIRKNCRFVN